MIRSLIIIISAYLFILFPAHLLAQSSEKHPFTLSGKLSGKDSGYVFLVHPQNNISVCDSFWLNHGHFVFTGEIQEPSQAIFSTFNFLTFNPKTYDSKNIIDIYLETGDMTFSASNNQFEFIELVGSSTDSDRVKVLKLKRPLWNIIDSISKPELIFFKAYKDESKNNPDSEKAKQLKRTLDSFRLYLDLRLRPYNDSTETIDSIFIIQNPTSYYAADMIWRRARGGRYSSKFLRKIYNNLPSYIQNSKYGKGIEGVIQFDNNIQTGMTAKNFIAVSESGDTIKLNAYVNKKYILLDFWASWCGPCRDISPLLNNISQKYKENLEVISIANNDKQADWEKAIKTDQMHWTQILDSIHTISTDEPGKSVTEMYYVNLIPTLILIDKNFKIIRIFGGSGENDSTIDSLNNELKKILEN
jgi:thiol-disulfide isomerase/thioredoxin